MLNKRMEQEVERRVAEMMEKERLKRSIDEMRAAFEALRRDVDKRFEELEKQVDGIFDELVPMTEELVTSIEQLAGMFNGEGAETRGIKVWVEGKAE